jgi:hypothetical protein
VAYDIGAICEGLAHNLSGLSGVQVSAYLLANPTPPACEIEPGTIKYDRAFGRGLDELSFIVRMFVGMTSDIGAQKRLYPFLAASGETSVKAAVESDCTLGGIVDDLQVQHCTGLKLFVREVSSPKGGRGSVQGPLLGAEWTVQILAEGR